MCGGDLSGGEGVGGGGGRWRKSSSMLCYVIYYFIGRLVVRRDCEVGAGVGYLWVWGVDGG